MRKVIANPGYHWITIESGRHHFIKQVFDSLGVRQLRLLVESSVTADQFDRARCDGLALVLGEYQGRTVAIAWSDFRVNAGCYSHANSRRFSAFIRLLRLEPDEGPPLMYVVSSAGLSLMQGRTLFSEAFVLWPELMAYAREHFLVTCAVGKCLGLATLLFGLGQYRLAVTGRTHLNLTGPEVIQLFFGEGVDFTRRASAEAAHGQHDLIHELVPSVESAFERWKALLARGANAPPVPPEGDATTTFLGSFLDHAPMELVPGWCASLRLFVGTRRGRPFGLFINPPSRSNNLITVRTLEKYAAGLDLFSAMRLPIVSFLDSPGVDPRIEQGDANNIRKLLWVGEKIIHYPYRMMGVVIGRCFGGASTLTLPKIFGGRRTLALRGSVIGVMQSGIIDEVLRQSPRLREQWRQTAAAQLPGLEDLLQSGMLDAVIDAHELPAELDRLLSEPGLPPRRGEAVLPDVERRPDDDEAESPASLFLARNSAR
jgi:propionyl-CoA carboxylase beta chain